MTSPPTNDPPPGAPTSNPVTIGRIGTDHIQVSIRPVLDDTELQATLHRLEQLIDAGYATVDVVLEDSEAPAVTARTTELDRRPGRWGPPTTRTTRGTEGTP